MILLMPSTKPSGSNAERLEALLEEIRVNMARKRITQATVAAHLEISRSAMSRRMLGMSDFTVDELYRLAGLFDVSVSDLLGEQKASA
jgi:transcriptional regulator with XRE-family HTH domain